jgi:hypothetical protein
MSQMTPYCFKCGAELDPEAIYCASCGRLQRSMVVRSSEPTPGATPPPPPPPPGPQHDPRYSFYPDRQEPGTPLQPNETQGFRGDPGLAQPAYAAQPQQPTQQHPDSIQPDQYGQNDWYGGEQGQPPPGTSEAEAGDHVYAQQSYDQHGYGQEGQAYGQPGVTYEQPDQAYGQPDQAYGQPDQAYGQPDQAYGQPDQAYGQHDQAYGQPEQAYGQATPYPEYDQTYSGPEAGAPQEAYGQQPYGQDQTGPAPYGQDGYGESGYAQGGYGQSGYGRQDAQDPYADQGYGYGGGGDPYAARAGASSSYSAPYTPAVYSPSYSPPRRRSGGVPRPLMIIAVFGGLFLVGILIGKVLIGSGSSNQPGPTANNPQQVVVPTQSTSPTAPPSVAPPLTSPTPPAVTGNANWQFVSIPNFTCSQAGCPITGNYKNRGQPGNGTVTFNVMDQAKTTVLASCTAAIPQADTGQTVSATCTANSDQLQQYFKTNGTVTVTAKVG